MFALGVEFLMGRAVMARPDDRDAAEWPPHPDRVFMALVAAWGERGEVAAERAALEWLENLAPPALVAAGEFSARTVATSFVPVNDDAKPRTPFDGMAFGRHRTGRTFPALVPADPVFHLVWEADVPADHRPALEALCAAVTYLGHSSSPVRVWLADAAPEPTLVPDARRAEVQLRVPGPGRLAYLVGQYNRVAIDEHERLTREVAELQRQHDAAAGRAKTPVKKLLTAAKAALDERFPAGAPQTLRPRPGRWHGYAKPAPPPSVGERAGGFDPGILVFRHAAGRRVGLEHAPALALALRGLLLTRFGAEPPAWVSGHDPDGTPTRQDRPACLPLGFVDREHADGRLMGLAVAAPVGFARDAMRKLVELLCAVVPESQDDEPRMPVLELTTTVGKLVFELDERPDGERAYTLRPSTWTRPACTWATVTPVLLPRYPRRGLTPEEVVAKCCTDAGYLEPAAVRAGPAPFLAGVPHVRSFPNRAKPGRPPRPLFHAVFTFPEPVFGPVLVGAGRYAGLGACRPLTEDTAS
jgi:CRISPR-associated protein Csb2